MYREREKYFFPISFDPVMTALKKRGSEGIKILLSYRSIKLKIGI